MQKVNRATILLSKDAYEVDNANDALLMIYQETRLLHQLQQGTKLLPASATVPELNHSEPFRFHKLLSQSVGVSVSLWCMASATPHIQGISAIYGQTPLHCLSMNAHCVWTTCPVSLRDSKLAGLNPWTRQVQVQCSIIIPPTHQMYYKWIMWTAANILWLQNCKKQWEIKDKKCTHIIPHQ